jgi:hypothetical protein
MGMEGCVGSLCNLDRAIARSLAFSPRLFALRAAPSGLELERMALVSINRHRQIRRRDKTGLMNGTPITFSSPRVVAGAGGLSWSVYPMEIAPPLQLTQDLRT